MSDKRLFVVCAVLALNLALFTIIPVYAVVGVCGWYCVLYAIERAGRSTAKTAKEEPSEEEVPLVKGGQGRTGQAVSTSAWVVGGCLLGGALLLVGRYLAG